MGINGLDPSLIVNDVDRMQKLQRDMEKLLKYIERSKSIAEKEIDSPEYQYHDKLIQIMKKSGSGNNTTCACMNIHFLPIFFSAKTSGFTFANLGFSCIISIT